MNNKQLFAKNLKAARKKAGLNQAQLAEKLSYSGKAISKWESGAALPPSEILPTLAKALEIDINTLFDFREDAGYFLGIDGGGTKTKFVLTDINGNIINELVLGGCNPTVIGIENCANLFYTGITQICQNIPTEKVSVFIGAAGCGIESNKKAIYERLSHMNFSSLAVDRDSENIIAAGLLGKDGVVAILGTGSVIFTSYNRVQHRIGGYGHFIGDTFSGSELGRACLEAVFGQLEKSGPATMLTEKVTAKIGTDISKILSDLYKVGKSYMAELAPFVFEAADKGDAVATDILNRNIKKFASQLSSALAMLPQNRRFPIILAGGITNFADRFAEKLKNEITASNLADIKILDTEPVMGAVMLAAENRSVNNA